MGNNKNIKALERLLELDDEILEDDPELEVLLEELNPNREARINEEWAKIRNFAFQRKVEETRAKSNKLNELAGRLKDVHDQMPARTEAVVFAKMERMGVAAQFNRLKEFDDETIKEIFEDIDLLEILESLENSEQ